MGILPVVFGLAPARPLQTPGRPLAHEAGGFQGHAALAVQDIGDDLVVAHRLRRPNRRPIEHTASVPRPIGAEAIDLQRVAVIQEAAHRAAADGDTGEPPVLPDADGELVSHRGLVVAVVLAHELVRLPQGDGDQRQHITHRPRRHGCPA